MAPVPAKGKKGKGAGLTKKLGPLPVWAWLLIGSAVGWYVFKKMGNSTSAAATPASQSTATDPTTGLDTSTGSGVGSSSGGVDAATLASALGASNADLASTLGNTFQQSNDGLLAQVENDLATYTGGAGGAATGTGLQGKGYTTSSSGAQPGTQNAPTYARVAANTENFASSAKAQSSNLVAAGKAAPFGGVTGVSKLKNGGSVTTYASGRKVEQVPGKSAYVIHQ